MPGTQRGDPADHLPLLLGLVFLMGSKQLKTDVPELQVRNGWRITFLWVADFPSRLQAHWREQTMAGHGQPSSCKLLRPSLLKSHSPQHSPHLLRVNPLCVELNVSPMTTASWLQFSGSADHLLSQYFVSRV